MTITSPDGLYHADIALPEGYRHPRAMVSIEYSRHSERAARDDRYGFIARPQVLNLTRFETVEVEVKMGRVAKIVVRGADLVEPDRDLVYVLIPRIGEAWFCKTVWVNLATDTHRTLDHSRYVH